jgi:hypothetical protein
MIWHAPSDRHQQQTAYSIQQTANNTIIQQQTNKMNQPPPVADASANAVLATAFGGPNPNVATYAGRAAKRAKTSLEIHQCDGNLVTIQEVGDQTIFATEAALAGFGGGAALPAGVPAWAVAMNANLIANMNAMNANFIANMNAGFAAVNANFAAVNTNLANVNTNLANVNARQLNGVASEDGDPIHEVLNNAGNPPPGAIFPVTFGALLALPNTNNGVADTLLQFYGTARNPRATRHQRLHKFLGVR